MRTLLLSVGLCAFGLPACGGEDGEATPEPPADTSSGDASASDVADALCRVAGCDQVDGSSTGEDAAEDTISDDGVTETELDGGITMGCEPPHTEVVTLTTDDGVILEGDLYTSGELDAPGVVLLHMIPPNNDRTGYPVAFCEALAAQGYNVLNIDRRGAGASGGVAQEAYSGPNGKLDPHAAVEHLLEMPCASDPLRLAIVGASNGTTSALDYTLWSQGEDDVRTPKVLVYLTGGTYTENQHSISENLEALSPIQSLFVYSTDEATWSVGFEATAPETWTFSEYPDGAHGTLMFDAIPESMDDVRAFLEGAL